MTEEARQSRAKRAARTVRVDLAREAKAIRRLQKRAAANSKLVLADVIEIGKRLAKAKGALDHGQWGPWLRQNFSWSADSAERYIRVARLSPKIRNVRNLDLPLTVIYALAARGTPQDVIDDVIRRSEAGEKITRGAVSKLVDNKPTVIVSHYSVPSQHTFINPVYTKPAPSRGPSNPEPEPDPVEPDPEHEPERADAAQVAAVLADLLTLEPPNPWALIEAVQQLDAPINPARWQALGRAVLAVATALRAESS